MKSYSIDLRQKIIEAYQNQEGSQRKLAQRFKVSLSFIQNLLKRYRETGEIAPRQRGKGFAPKLAKYLKIVEQLVSDQNDARLLIGDRSGKNLAFVKFVSSIRTLTNPPFIHN